MHGCIFTHDISKYSINLCTYKIRMAWIYPGTIAGPSNQRQGAQTLFWFHKVQWNLKTSNVEISGVDLDPIQMMGFGSDKFPNSTFFGDLKGNQALFFGDVYIKMMIH